MPAPIAEDIKRAAINAAVESRSLAEGSRKSGIAKTTLSQWLKQAQIDTSEWAPEQVAKTANATAVSLAVRQEKVESFRERMTDLLTEGAELAITKAIELIPEAQKASDLPAVVGMFTRSIHDVLLLTGEATSRTESIDPQERAQQAIDELKQMRDKRQAG